MSTSFHSSLSLPSRFLVAVCVLFVLPVAASAGTKTVPCATDSHQRAVIFNTANGNGYNCTITITTNADGSEDIRINQPVVGSEAKNGFPYRPIVLSPGDLITITADGCVQTAGSGSTWKRYVNPQGGDSGPHVANGLYFGAITIAGAVTRTGALPPDKPLDDLGAAVGNHDAQIFLEVVQTIPGRADPQMLTLGYKDDNYDDHGGNGYWGHDNGNNGQCANTDVHAPFGKFGGSAFVKLHIVHNAKNPFAAAVARQWDMVPNGLDINGLFLNPEWGWEVNGQPIATDGVWDPKCLAHGCSSQDPSFDSASLTATNWPSHLFANVCDFDTGPSGHHNWFDVTYTGSVKWVEHSGGAFGDDDYNMSISTPVFHFNPPGTSLGPAAGTSFLNNTPDNSSAEASIGLEFDSDETIDHFDQNQFWHTFHQTVDNSSDQAVDNMIDGHDVVVIGLMGFDEMHGGYTEIHPVHALAIREGRPVPGVSNTPDPKHDRWFFFVRNWGDEGECSQYQHFLQTDTITLQIPPPVLGVLTPPIATLSKERSQVLGTGTDHIVHFFSGPQGTFVTFKLSDAVSQPFAFGEFELAWSPVGGPPFGAHHVPAAGKGQPKAASERKPEERLETIRKSATPLQQQLYKTLVVSLLPPKRAIVSEALTFDVLPTPPQRPARAPAVTTGPAPRKLQRDAARLQAMCAATGGKLPTQPTWCSAAKVPPVSILTTTGGTRGADGRATPVTAILTVYDASGLGLGQAQYSLDGKTWKPYTGPITVPAGTSTVYHRSQDKEGNLEDIRQHTLSVTGAQGPLAPVRPK